MQHNIVIRQSSTPSRGLLAYLLVEKYVTSIQFTRCEQPTFQGKLYPNKVVYPLSRLFCFGDTIYDFRGSCVVDIVSRRRQVFFWFTLLYLLCGYKVLFLISNTLHSVVIKVPDYCGLFLPEDKCFLSPYNVIPP